MLLSFVAVFTHTGPCVQSASDWGTGMKAGYCRFGKEIESPRVADLWRFGAALSQGMPRLLQPRTSE